MGEELIKRLRVQKTVDEMTPDELDKADFIYGHEMCVLDGRMAADRIAALIEAGDRLVGMLDEVQRQGCEVCAGDCASAMPPVVYCPTKVRSDALKAWKEVRGDD